MYFASQIELAGELLEDIHLLYCSLVLALPFDDVDHDVHDVHEIHIRNLFFHTYKIAPFIFFTCYTNSVCL